MPIISGGGGGSGGSGFSPVSCVVTRSTNQVFGAAETAVTFDTAEYDPTGMFSGTSPTRVTIATPGVYALDGTLAWNANAATAILSIRKNGSEPGGIISRLQITATAGRSFVVSGATLCVAGDFFELMATNPAGGTADVTVVVPRLSVIQVG